MAQHTDLSTDRPLIEQPVAVLAARLEAIVPDLLARARVPGLSLAVVRDGTLCWSRAFGVRSADTAVPLDETTAFRAASLSKPLFAYAVLRLVDQGVLELDRPLTDYVDERYAPDDPLLPRITARHVLSHTTGWPVWRTAGQPLGSRWPPGERFGYSCETYQYLQFVVEQVTDQPLDVFMARTALAPLGMARSSYAWPALDDPTVAASHDREGRLCASDRARRPEAAISLHTTAADYARFVCAMLAPDAPGGQRQGGGRLRAASLAEMLRRQVRVDEVAEGAAGAIWWGLGWGLEATAAHRAFWHWGDTRGYKAFVIASPVTRAGIILLTNGDGGLSLCEPLVRLVLGGDHPAFAFGVFPSPLE